MSETLIAVKNLVKEYGNGVRALDQIDLEIGRGDIFGIIECPVPEKVLWYDV